MHVRHRLTLVVGAALLSMVFLVEASDAATPNIVVILTDDQGYADISLNPHHADSVSTPAMDALARDGVVFSQGYTSGHVCSPTRAGIMIGGYSQRVGVYTAGDGGRGFDPSKKIFPAYLPQRYVSTAIGKWHLGLDDDYPELKWHAMNRGFDECYKFMGRGGHSYFDLRSDTDGKFSGPIYRNKKRINDEGYLTNRLSEEAVAFIDRNKSNPFFLYLAYNAVHAPAEAPDEDIKAYQAKFPEISDERAILMAMLKHLDDGVGDVVGKLKQEGIFDQTLLFFLTDNGGSQAMSADNTPLRGFKQSLDEGGIRTPFIVSWPDKFGGGRVIDTPVISFDILPTALDAIGATPADHDFDGKSLLPLLTNGATDHHETLYWSKGKEGEWAVRRGDWKLHQSKKKVELIDLAKDVSESSNLFESHPDKVQELTQAYEKWISQMAEPITGGGKGFENKGKGDSANSKSEAKSPSQMTEREKKREAIRAERAKQRKERKGKNSQPDLTHLDTDPGNQIGGSVDIRSQTLVAKVGDSVGESNRDVIHLGSWKLTLPVDKEGRLSGHAAEVSSDKLVAGYRSDFFYRNDQGELVFWCPTRGARTEGTRYPRSELREMRDANDVDVNWTAHGTHALNARCRLTQVPDYPKVVIGQIHSCTGKTKPLVKLQYYKGRIEALVKLSPSEGQDRKLTFADTSLGDEWNYQIKLQDGLLSVSVNGETQTEDIFENDPEWARQSFYFKAGLYPQDNDGPSTEGARIAFSDLQILHQDRK